MALSQANHPSGSATNMGVKKARIRATPKTVTLNNYMTYSFSSSVPKKYFSKPKVKTVDQWCEDVQTANHK
jgi:hypothetical protein